MSHDIFHKFLRNHIWRSASFKAKKQTKKIITDISLQVLENVYMRPEVNSDRFEISNRFEMSFRLHGNLHGDFTAATFQTIARL